MEGVTCPVLDTANLDAFLMELAKSGENFEWNINSANNIAK